MTRARHTAVLLNALQRAAAAPRERARAPSTSAIGRSGDYDDGDGGDGGARAR